MSFRDSVTDIDLPLDNKVILETESHNVPLVLLKLGDKLVIKEFDVFPLYRDVNPDDIDLVSNQRCSCCNSNWAQIMAEAYSISELPQSNISNIDTVNWKDPDVRINYYFLCEDCLSKINASVEKLASKNEEQLLSHYI